MASRRIEDLHPVAADKCRRLVALSKEKGIELIITSTLRTEAEQLALFSQGRKTLRAVNEMREAAGMPAITESENRIVTKNLTSIHQYGCAFDIAVIEDGKAVWKSPKYDTLGVLGESIGLRWGGRFTFKDYVHFEYTGGLSLADLKAGKRPTYLVKEA